MSTDMLVTPGTEKSNGGTSYPNLGRNAIIKLPRQESTCTGMLYFNPNAAIPSMSSIVP